ncbi:hypothetical protein BC332_30257 [Capsicum chinense]|nr:hypothetical protein BC332_30257 [Capsicum chinense]
MCRVRNPVKLSLSQYASKVVGRKHFFSNIVIRKWDGKVVSILWGSLGANAINVAILHLYSEMLNKQKNLFLIWQTGVLAYHKMESLMKFHPRLYITLFLHSTDLAYAAADLLISIAGAMICSEVLAAEKPCILFFNVNYEAISFEVAEVEPCVTVKVALCDPEVTSRSRGSTFCRNAGNIKLLPHGWKTHSKAGKVVPVGYQGKSFAVLVIIRADDLSAGFLRKQQCKKSFPSGDNVSERKRKLGLPPEDPAFPKPSTAPVVEEKKDDDAKVKTAFNTLLTYAKNVATNPNEKKFRKIRLLVMLLFSDKFRKYFENLEIALAFASAYELSITIGGPQEMDNWYTSAKLLGLFKNVYGKSLPLQQLSSVWALGLP